MRSQPTRLALLFGILTGLVLMLGCQQLARSFGEGVGNRVIHSLDERGAIVSGDEGPVPRREDYETAFGYYFDTWFPVLLGTYFMVRRRVPALSNMIEGKKRIVEVRDT